MESITIYSDPSDDCEYTVLVPDEIEDYDDEGELDLADAEALAEEIQKLHPKYKITRK